jgi:hypothetical protein
LCSARHSLVVIIICFYRVKSVYLREQCCLVFASSCNRFIVTDHFVRTTEQLVHRARAVTLVVTDPPRCARSGAMNVRYVLFVFEAITDRPFPKKQYWPSIIKTFNQDRRICAFAQEAHQRGGHALNFVCCFCLVFLWVLVWRPRPQENRLPVALFGAERFYVVWCSTHYCFVVKIVWFGLVNEDFMRSPNSFLRLVWFSFPCHRPFSLDYRTARSPGARCNVGGNRPATLRALRCNECSVCILVLKTSHLQTVSEVRLVFTQPDSPRPLTKTEGSSFGQEAHQS